MKSTIKFFLAAIATGMMMASCSDELISEENGNYSQSEGTRTIAVSFGPQTRTALGGDGLTPEFADKDKIFLCTNPKNSEEVKTQICTVDVDGTGKATVTTKLTGALTAFYPASLVISGKKGLNIYVPSNQDGTFAEANICSTTIEENATSATFKNDYALFVITPPEGTKKLTVKSLRPIGDDGQRSVTERKVICGTGDDLYKITVGDGSKAIPSPCYVAMNYGVNLSDLSFEATFDAEGTTGHIKGIPTSAIAAAAGTDVAVGSDSYNTCNTVAVGTVYTINNSNWHEYVTIGERKWATMNLKTSETAGDYDDYYMWGTTVVAYSDIETPPCSLVVMKTENPYGDDYKLTWAGDKGFSWENCPFTNGVYSESSQNVFTKYVPETCGSTYGNNGFSDNKTHLDLCDDAAYVHWGGAWRMPMINELLEIASSNFTLNGVIKNSESSSCEIDNYAGIGYYWSSSIQQDNPSNALCVKFDPGESGVQESQPRFYGMSIRAIIDDLDAVEDIPAVALPGEFSVDANGRKVKFASGNLTYNVSTKKWSFFANQYDCATEYDANLLSYFNWGYNATQSIIPDATLLNNVTRSSGNLSQEEDWGSQIGDGNTWRTPTQAEWSYILNTRTNAANKVGYATVGTVCGIVILPDVFTLPSSCTFTPKATTKWDANSYTIGNSGTWKDMEEAGAVFLPAAGSRVDQKLNQVGEYGRYWSSSVAPYGSDFQSYFLIFSDGSISPSSYERRSYSLNVRLVQNVPQARK